MAAIDRFGLSPLGADVGDHLERGRLEGVGVGFVDFCRAAAGAAGGVGERIEPGLQLDPESH